MIKYLREWNTSLKNIDYLIQNKDQINDRDLEALYNLTVAPSYSSFAISLMSQF